MLFSSLHIKESLSAPSICSADIRTEVWFTTVCAALCQEHDHSSDLTVIIITPPKPAYGCITRPFSYLHHQTISLFPPSLFFSCHLTRLLSCTPSVVRFTVELRAPCTVPPSGPGRLLHHPDWLYHDQSERQRQRERECLCSPIAYLVVWAEVTHSCKLRLDLRVDVISASLLWSIFQSGREERHLRGPAWLVDCHASLKCRRPICIHSRGASQLAAFYS